jgi:hypothetical protein
MEHSEQYPLEGTRAIGGNGTPMFETRSVPALETQPFRGTSLRATTKSGNESTLYLRI